MNIRVQTHKKDSRSGGKGRAHSGNRALTRRANHKDPRPDRSFMATRGMTAMPFAARPKGAARYRTSRPKLTGDVKLELFNDEFLITDDVLDQVAY